MVANCFVCGYVFYCLSNATRYLKYCYLGFSKNVINAIKMKKAGKKWIAFDFNPEKEKSPVSKQNEKPDNVSHFLLEKAKSSDTIAAKTRNFNFEFNLRPKLISDLAIHPKKVKEVKFWLQNNVLIENSQKTATFLLITGPTGSGKTTTIRVLCENMSINLSEWVNPMDQDFEFFGQNQITRFTEFLTESKWNSLFSVFNKRIIVVEEFPNILIRSPEKFGEVLEECYYKGNYPIVFICSDSFNQGRNLSDTLFPQEIRNKYNITNISFNACAATLIKNAIKRAHNLVQENLDLFKTPSPNTVDAIIASSMGDIRCAINQYYFASLLGTSDLPSTKITTKQGSKRKRNENTSSIKFMSRDENLGLFHGLGRVLNPKRTETNGSWKLNCDVEKLIDEFLTQPGTFTSFLFENYLKYFGDLKDVTEAANTLSSAQIFLEKWIDHQDTLQYALWISVMGLMIHNKHRVSKWNQITGPKKVKKSVRDENIRNLTATDLYYYNLIVRKGESQFKRV